MSPPNLALTTGSDEFAPRKLLKATAFSLLRIASLQGFRKLKIFENSFNYEVVAILSQVSFLVALFLRKESTIVMAFRQCFFDTPEVTKIVYRKFQVLKNFKAPNCTCWPRELKQKSFFPRNIQYRARLKGPPFRFFGIVRLFSKKIPKGSPSFFGVLRQNG